MTKENVLITGATSGIGLELARVFAKNGHSLVLVAPVEAELKTIASDLESKYKIEVRYLSADLSTPDSSIKIVEKLSQLGLQVDILVNNAGFGQKGNFWEVPLETLLSMIAVNVEAVVGLTHLLLPAMIARKRGRVLNTASIAGFQAGPTMAVYHATKAFVLSLSEALAIELKDTGVTLTALCPGPVDTDFFPKAGMVETKAFQKGNLMAPQEVAAAGYEALMKGDPLIVPGATNKAMVFSRRFLTEEAQAKANAKQYEDVPPEDLKRVPGEVAARGRH
ncbi:MAG: SDR family oxidoreductase [Nibricoccus sp.]